MKRTLSVLTLLVATSALVASMAFAQGSPAATPATPASPAKTTTTARTEKKSMAKAPAMPVIDINSASKEDLMKLQGVGDATAEKIIAGRPYTSKAQLESKKIVTRAEYAKIRTHITAKQAK